MARQPALALARPRTVPALSGRRRRGAIIGACIVSVLGLLYLGARETSIFALEVDPRDAALRETEEAIGLVLGRAEAVELSPQNAYIRRLQHQMAERANLVSRSRGREPYRRVRLYPDPARSPWR